MSVDIRQDYPSGLQETERKYTDSDWYIDLRQLQIQEYIRDLEKIIDSGRVYMRTNFIGGNSAEFWIVIPNEMPEIRENIYERTGSLIGRLTDTSIDIHVYAEEDLSHLPIPSDSKLATEV